MACDMYLNEHSLMKSKALQLYRCVHGNFNLEVAASEFCPSVQVEYHVYTILEPFSTLCIRSYCCVFSKAYRPNISGRSHYHFYLSAVIISRDYSPR